MWCGVWGEGKHSTVSIRGSLSYITSFWRLRTAFCNQLDTENVLKWRLRRQDNLVSPFLSVTIVYKGLINSIINVINDLKFWFTCKWTLYVSMEVVCSPLQQPRLLECASSTCWLVQWSFWITFALHNNRFRPYGKRAWGWACEPSALEKMLGVNFWILFYQSLFLT